MKSVNIYNYNCMGNIIQWAESKLPRSQSSVEEYFVKGEVFSKGAFEQ